MRCRIAADTKRKSRYIPGGCGGGSAVAICPLLFTAAFFLPPVLAGLFVLSRSILCNKHIHIIKKNANTNWNDKVHIFLTTWMVLINNRRLSTMKWTLKGKIKSYDIKLGNKSIKYPLGIVNFKEIDSFYLGTRTCHKLLFVSRGSIWYSH